jgi:uncharacterized membrane protein
MHTFSWGLYTMSALYIIAGLFHFIKPKIYMSIMPPYIPFQNALVYISGIAEIILGVAILFNNTHIYALWSIIIMLILFLPVHFYMVSEKKFEKKIPKWALILLITIKFNLIYWAYIFI